MYAIVDAPFPAFDSFPARRTSDQKSVCWYRGCHYLAEPDVGRKVEGDGRFCPNDVGRPGAGGIGAIAKAHLLAHVFNPQFVAPLQVLLNVGLHQTQAHPVHGRRRREAEAQITQNPYISKYK